MKSFFKTFLACLLAFVISWVLIIIMFGIIMASAFSSTETVVHSNSILEIKFDTPIIERSTENPFDDIDFETMSSTKNIGLNDILFVLDKAASDSRIKGIYLNLSSVQASAATVEEIRNALLKFKKSGKFILAYSEVYSQSAYYLATVADKVYLNPHGSIDFRGISVQIMFFKDLLKKLDVNTQIIRHGTFKSAVEPYMYDKMSDANKLQMQVLIKSIWNNMLTGISIQRKVSFDDLNILADELRLSDANNAIASGMIDSLIYETDMQEIWNGLLGFSKDKKLNLISINSYKNADFKEENSEHAKDKIAVIYAVGNIIDGEGGEDAIGAATFTKEIKKAYNDKKTKAIVLRINSPGGSALASELIWNEIERAKKQNIPVIVSMGDYAASGGYYIACNANKIVAQPNTITGSIGVFGVIPNIQNLLKNKFGITIDGVKTNDYSDGLSVFRPMDSYEQKMMQESIERIYKTFTGRVASGRNMSVSKVDSIGQGRVLSGYDAKNIGLVDTLGGIDLAIKIAAQQAGIEYYKIQRYPMQTDWITKMMEQTIQTSAEQKLKNELGSAYIYAEQLKNVMNMKGIQARMPMNFIFE